MKIKYAAVIVATILHFFLGGLWYSPLLFGNKFLQIIAWTPQQLAAIEAKGEAVGSSRVDLQACKLEYSIVSPK